MALTKAILTGLTSDQFRHPLDLQATQTLRQLPGLDLVIRNVLGPTAEQFFYLDNISSSILVGDRQLPHLYDLLVEACEILDLEQPQLYIKQNPIPNAYTFAMRGKQPFIVMHTSLVDLLTPEEIQAVIAHELGHLKCDHGVYLSLANLLVLASTELIPFGGLIAQSLQSQIMEWVRCAEFTCDRAALLVAQDSRIVASVLMKLTGGSASLAQHLNLDAFLEQARSYDAASTTEIGAIFQQLQTSQLTHPLPVLRAREIEQWGSSQEYQNVLKVRTMPYSRKSKNKGEWRNW